VAEPDHPETLYEVIGVVKDTKYANLREDIPPITYVPAAQRPSPGPWAGVVIRSSAAFSEVINQVRRKVVDLSPDITVQFKVFETQIREGLIRERLMAWMAGFFGTLAAVLALAAVAGFASFIPALRASRVDPMVALRLD